MWRRERGADTDDVTAADTADSPHSADYAVIGAGVVGLAVARELARSRPDASVLVLDKEVGLARHASGRNSGVLHAGFYYSPDSLKARLTRRGNVLLHEFCADHGVRVRRVGKVVVAQSAVDVERLADLAGRAAANDVPVELISAEQLAEFEPLAQTYRKALWSPTTSVADPSSVVVALAVDAQRHGVRLALGEHVTIAQPGRVTTRSGTRSVGHVVNCAGLYADRVAQRFGFCDDYSMLPFKGIYRSLTWPAGRLQRHVYPVPDPQYPFLGVHITVTVEGRAKIGPTAIPVLTRENYRGLEGLRRDEVLPVAQGLARFLGHSPRESRRLVATELRKYRPQALRSDAARLVPSLRPDDVGPPGRPGIRAQLVHRRTGELEMDFIVRGDDRSTHVLNAVSPAWTSALAVAEHVVAGIPG